jgi:hypothetical protein
VTVPAWQPLRRAALSTVLMLAMATALLVPLAADASASAGCVSRAEYRRVGQGQTMRYIRRAVGDDAQISHRRWTQSGSRYQERRYDMCRPYKARYDTLTTRFMVYRGAWRAYLVDLYVGPER